MTTIGILGAGQAGSTIARAAIAAGYDVIIANSKNPETLLGLVSSLRPAAQGA
ncbi:MAG: NAD(P)-binding domain-containing protein, partial [Arthrobacter sp.]